MKTFQVDKIIQDNNIPVYRLRPDKFVTQANVVKQNIEARCKIIKKELETNVELGMPIGHSQTEMELAVSNIILDTPGVYRINQLSSKMQGSHYITHAEVQSVFGIVEAVTESIETTKLRKSIIDDFANYTIEELAHYTIDDLKVLKY